MLTACVTQRKKDEAKGFKLFMHNLTAKYNGYFNANVLVLEATEKLVEQHQDNYSQILDIYPYLAVDNPSAVAPDLDKAIEKVAVVATYHRPSHWVDDCYLMMGKAQFLKHDFESSEETFAYLTENYNPSLKKKLNKKDKAKATAEAREEKQKQRVQKAKDAKKEREQAIKDKAKEKEEKAKQAEKDKKDREEELKKAKEDEAQRRKDVIKDKKLSLEERNEQKRKENAERTEQRRKEREEKERLAKQGVKTEKKTETNTDKAPSVTNDSEDKKETATASTNDKKAATKAEDDGKLPKVDKPKAKPDNYFLKHRPCYQEGVVWYARALAERQNYVDAEVLLDEIDKNPKTFKDIRVMSAIARADLNLKQKNYDGAIAALERSISLSKKKKEKARLAYILAQLYQQKGNSEKAYAAFDKVLDYGPAYEMEFNSRLNKSLNDAKAGDQTTASLIKMSKDFKNREYGDQIYFTLAQIALKKGDKPQCIAYLEQALSAPGRGKNSKAEAYYMMATLQYEVESFVLAKSYYDSASTTLSKTDIRRDESARYAVNLMDIAKNIQIINLQDSLLKVANLSDKEKKELASRIKKDRLKKATASANPSVSGGGGKLSDFDLADAAKKSKFWGYNTELTKKGKREFERKWGTDRKNEDNWRRINKRSNGDFTKAVDTEVASSDMTAKEYQDIMKDVPKTPKDVEDAQTKIENAMYQLGTLYHDKLKNDKKAIGMLENYLTRFPKTKQELEAWYYLYNAHTEVGNKPKAQDYYDKIMEKYPTTSYATMLKDKDKPKSVEEKETVEKYYSETYNLFKAGKYKEAQVRIKESDTKYGVSNALKAKFALLDAMCTGHEMGRINYVAALKEVVNKYAGTPEDKRAQEILRILEFGAPVTEAPNPTTNNGGEETEDPVKKFVLGDEKLHYVIIVLNKNADLEDAKVVVSEFDSKYHRTEALNVSSMFFSTESETPVVVVRKFRDKALALKYTEGVAKNTQDFLKGVYEVFAISQDNYREVIRQKSVESYRKFYEVNYK